jgi:glycosyltransferase involved in cell wall biosynthesis
MAASPHPAPFAAPAPLAGPGAPHRILVDLSHAAAGYVGIAQDTRLIFDMLAGLPGVEATGLLMPTGRHDLPRITPDCAGDVALAAGVLHWMSRNWDTRGYPRIMGPFWRLLEFREWLRSSHALMPVPDAVRSSALWRVLFEKTLAPERREETLSRAFQATDLSVMRIIDRATKLGGLPPKRLDAPGFDFAFFCMPRPVRLPRGTRQIVRFHDAVPVTDTDTVATWQTGAAHQTVVRGCVADAVFVCNSPQSQHDLAALDPGRAALSRVIPCALAPAQARPTQIPFTAIIDSRRTFRALDKAPPDNDLPPIDPDCRYVLAVSTMEPRKNYPGLIRGWERVLNRSDPDLHLIIVANTGWLEGPVLRAMAPHIRRGRIIHLESLPQDELLSLAAGSVCFAFPSFNEGFGYPPLEALQAGACPIVSDIPVFRWIFGDGALYVDPYDPETLAEAIERLAVHPDRHALRAELLSRREAVLDRFRPATVRLQWAALLDDLSRQPPA